MIQTHGFFRIRCWKCYLFLTFLILPASDVAGSRELVARLFSVAAFYFVTEFICGVFVNKDVLNVL